VSKIDLAQAWQAVLNRDRRFNGKLVYAVSSTGIYCRPTCPSRRPAPRHVAFFSTPHQAEAAGYRACLRCHPQLSSGDPSDKAVERARRYLDEHVAEPVTLDLLSKEVGLSPWHLQRLFRARVGLSPKAYHAAQRIRRLKSCLRAGSTVTQATYEAGFGSGSRVYERFLAETGMTPGRFRSGGHGVTLRYAMASTVLGRVLVAATDRGLVAVSLNDDDESLLESLRQDYPRAALRRDQVGLQGCIRAVRGCLDGQTVKAVPVHVTATAFQRLVWCALQRIPRGHTRSYREIAVSIGVPSGARAVARACATNPLAILVPCHRAVRGDGRLAGYRWGIDRKARLLALERASRSSRARTRRVVV